MHPYVMSVDMFLIIMSASCVETSFGNFINHSVVSCFHFEYKAYYYVEYEQKLNFLYLNRMCINEEVMLVICFYIGRYCEATCMYVCLE